MPVVVLAEDNETTLFRLAQIMEKGGHTVLKAANGSEALEILENNHADILVTDIFMDNIDGIELLEQVLKKYKNLPVITMSSETVQGRKNFMLEIADKLGSNLKLYKPVKPDQLLNGIERLLKKVR